MKAVFSVIKDSYYIIELASQTSVSCNLSNVRIIKSIANRSHIKMQGYAGSIDVYYVYTNADTVNVTCSGKSYLSYSKMRLFE